MIKQPPNRDDKRKKIMNYTLLGLSPLVRSDCPQNHRFEDVQRLLRILRRRRMCCGRRFRVQDADGRLSARSVIHSSSRFQE